MKVEQEWIKRQSRATPVLYTDLDGTIRKGPDQLEGRFVNCAADVEVFPEVPGILAEYKKHGWRIVAISNQGGIALGILSAEDCALAMLETYRQTGEIFDQMCYCTHHPNAADPEHAVCWCRKPRIGLLVKAGMTMNMYYNEYYPPHLALFVGDREEDKQCAENAGIRFADATLWRAGGWRSFLTGTSEYFTLDETTKTQ